MYSISGEVSGSRSRASPSISSAICERVDALADQRLVDVEVEEAHLRLGDLADRLRVDPDQLQQRDEREAGPEHVARSAPSRPTSCSLSVPSIAVGVPSSAIIRSISASSRPAWLGGLAA